ncbi:MAG: porin, partial [Candidatus Aenigmatarchaeota archaeon]
FPSFDEEPKKKALKGWGVSFDQDLIKERLGVFARVGFQDDTAQVDYKRLYSLGLSSKICIPQFRELTFGAGYAYLKAPSRHEELKNTRLFEAYVAIPIYEVEKKFSSVLTLD